MAKLTNFLVLFLVLINSLYSQQNFLSTSGTSIVNQSGDTIIFRGMGIGSWMIQEG